MMVSRSNWNMIAGLINRIMRTKQEEARILVEKSLSIDLVNCYMYTPKANLKG